MIQPVFPWERGFAVGESDTFSLAAGPACRLPGQAVSAAVESADSDSSSLFQHGHLVPAWSSLTSMDRSMASLGVRSGLPDRPSCPVKISADSSRSMSIDITMCRMSCSRTVERPALARSLAKWRFEGCAARTESQ
jgi:hypothetical protein